MSVRNAELASFLQSRRRRLTPNEIGLTQNSHRRIPYLRREEVAWAADVGITWYTWLEQGRPIKIACETLNRIAAAL
ncbi:MAG TPA: helix-turn-helix domain-containing protein, partial [Candidatus Nitrosotalea sp.]|nr:helix-turn-helix domain-containing protein [Candidatus Nitrosotalea sp.]